MKYILMVILFIYSAFSYADSPVCNPSMQEIYVGWPTENPVWEMCYLRPLNSSSIDGSSLEIRQVYFNGHQVFERAHMPMLFAQYTSGLCYRDWKDDDSPFIKASGIENPSQAAITTCDISTSTTQPVGGCPFGLPGFTGNDCMTGVQVEKYDDHMVLTTNHAASWYKYSSRFIFHADGRIQPRFGFGNSSGTNNSITHWHHGYWRLNFDIDGADNDQVFIVNNSIESLQNEEFAGYRGVHGTRNDPNWVVKDSVTGRGYRIEPGSGGVSQQGGIDDYAVPTNPSGAGHHNVDVMASKYKVLNNSVIEYSDTPNSNNLGVCEIFDENLVGDPLDPGNLPESMIGEDVVFWYRTAVHDIAPAGMLCKTGGPTLYPVGDWSLSPVDLIFINGFE